MSRIDPPEDENLADRDRELLADIAEIHGFVPNQHELDVHFPLLLRSLTDLNRRVMLAGELDPDLLERIALILAVENDCEYCANYHRTLLEHRDVPPAEIAALEANWRDVDFDGRDFAVVEFAVTVNDDPHGITDAAVDRLRDLGLTPQDLVQLVHFVNVMRGYNTFNVVFDTDMDTGEGGWTEGG